MILTFIYFIFFNVFLTSLWLKTKNVFLVLFPRVTQSGVSCFLATAAPAFLLRNHSRAPTPTHQASDRNQFIAFAMWPSRWRKTRPWSGPASQTRGRSKVIYHFICLACLKKERKCGSCLFRYKLSRREGQGCRVSIQHCFSILTRSLRCRQMKAISYRQGVVFFYGQRDEFV